MAFWTHLPRERPLWAFALLALSLLSLCGALPAVVTVVTGPESFLAALSLACSSSAPQHSRLELRRPISLSTRAAAAYSLPFRLKGSLELFGAGGLLVPLYLDNVVQLIFISEGSTLTLRNLNISGIADPQWGTWPLGVGPTVAQRFPLWPTIGAASGAEIRSQNVLLALHPTPFCLPEVIQDEVDALKLLMDTAGARVEDCIYRQGQGVVFAAPSTTPIPVVNATTRKSAGTVLFSASNSTVTCTLPADGDSSTHPSGSVVPVSSAQEFIAALFSATAADGAASTVLELQQEILVNSESAHAYSLPFVLGGGGSGGAARRMDWRGAGTSLVHLDLGGVAGLLFIQAGSLLRWFNLNVTGLADSQFGRWPDVPASPTVVQTLPCWPTISGDGGFKMETQRVALTMYPNPLCTPEIVAAEVEALQRLATGSNDFYSEGTLVVFPPGPGKTTEVALSVVNATTKLFLGEAQLSVSDCNITCPLSADASGPSPSSPGVVVSVRDGAEFFSALSTATGLTAPQQTTIELQGDVDLAPAAAGAASRMPYRLGTNRTLEWRGAGGKLVSLDCGQLPGLLFLEEGSTLRVNDLNLTGLADSQWGSWPQGVDGPYVIQSLPLWPTVSGEPGFKVDMDSMELDIVSQLCTQEGAAEQFRAFQQYQQSVGGGAAATTPISDYTMDNSTGTLRHRVRIASVAMQVPVLSSATKLGVGLVDWSINNTVAVCILAAGNSSSEATSGAGSSGAGLPPWAWALVAVAAALAVMAVAAAAAALHRSRTRLRRQQHGEKPDLESRQQQQEQPPPDASPQVLLTSGQSSLPCSPRSLGSASTTSSCTPGSPRGVDRLSHPNDSMQLVQDGVWRSKVGFIDGLQVGALLGRGGFARVYRGTWRGSPVAVKVIETRMKDENHPGALHNEPLLSLALSHPNVLPSYKSCIVKVLDCKPDESDVATNGTGSSAAGAAIGSCNNEAVLASITDAGCKVQVVAPDAALGPGLYEVWLVSELADKGSLADAMVAGRFLPPERHMPAILLCLLDIARGLDYLHSCGVVHVDLKPHNVLLASMAGDQRGYTLKLCDFGLSRILQDESHMHTGSLGTATHAAPELVQDGLLTKASDIYSLALLMYELLSGQPPFPPDMSAMQIVYLVATKGYRPPIPASLPPALAALVQRCWHADPGKRPSAASVAAELTAVQASLQLEQPAAPPATARADSTSLRSLSVPFTTAASPWAQ